MSEIGAQPFNDEDLTHWQSLLVEHKRYLRIVEKQIAGHGRLGAPPDLLRKEEIAKHEINDVTQRIRRRLKHISDDKLLYSDEEVDAVINQLLDIHALELKLDSFVGTREELKRSMKYSTYNISIFKINVVGSIFYFLASFIFLFFAPIEMFVRPFSIYIIVLIFLTICSASFVFLVKNIQQFRSESKKREETKELLDGITQQTADIYEHLDELKLRISSLYRGLKISRPRNL